METHSDTKIVILRLAMRQRLRLHPWLEQQQSVLQPLILQALEIRLVFWYSQVFGGGHWISATHVFDSLLVIAKIVFRTNNPQSFITLAFLCRWEHFHLIRVEIFPRPPQSRPSKMIKRLMDGWFSIDL